MLDIRILETLIALVAFFIIRIVSIKIITKIQSRYNYSAYRINPILKSINIFVILVTAIVLIAIWGLEQTNILTFIASVLTVVGIALVAQWSILSNISSAIIIFISHPVKLGENITIIDKDYDIKGQVSDIGLFYVVLKTDKNDVITIPNNIFLQKAIKINL